MDLDTSRQAQLSSSGFLPRPVSCNHSFAYRHVNKWHLDCQVTRIRPQKKWENHGEPLNNSIIYLYIHSVIHSFLQSFNHSFMSSTKQPRTFGLPSEVQAVDLPRQKSKQSTSPTGVGGWVPFEPQTSVSDMTAKFRSCFSTLVLTCLPRNSQGLLDCRQKSKQSTSPLQSYHGCLRRSRSSGGVF